MTGPETEAAYVRQVLAEARQVRDALGAGREPPDPKLLPLLLTKFSQLIDVTESMLSERERFESRLQRSHAIPFSADFNSEARP